MADIVTCALLDDVKNETMKAYPHVFSWDKFRYSRQYG